MQVWFSTITETRRKTNPKTFRSFQAKPSTNERMRFPRAWNVKAVCVLRSTLSEIGQGIQTLPRFTMMKTRCPSLKTPSSTSFKTNLSPIPMPPTLKMIRMPVPGLLIIPILWLYKHIILMSCNTFLSKADRSPPVYIFQDNVRIPDFEASRLLQPKSIEESFSAIYHPIYQVLRQR